MKKPHLPQKTCVVCGRPFAWRRRWARCWEEVRYCSARCRGQRDYRALLPQLSDHPEAR
ncbi:DUF2256 domain-containing protein [Aquipseudomonas alcaligenes]|uniref:DUF2256 domain-containing protein n=1 Tax=Aquipseudomonas alcaligenes TaxID=43263 RepID=UPI0016592B40|nr:DUF2256 domain-containing protein [Pseudomonas alcaligenes]